MQIEKSTTERIKGKLKKAYPGEYAIKLVEKLRLKGVSVSRQQVYNFFNNIPVSRKAEIINASVELLQEAKEAAQNINRLVAENL